jgi:inorganic pyrophosphatase
MESFWRCLDKLIEESEVVIDRPKGSSHPKYKSFVYPIDYGYIMGTTSSDKHEIDVWIGSIGNKYLDSVICTVDILKKDIELKLLLGCSEADKVIILKCHNNSKFMSAIIIERGK